MRVLVVEDSQVAQRFLAAKLRALGCTVRLPGDGEAAHALFAKERFSLVVMDRELPDVDGCELLRQLRALDGPNRLTAVIGLSATITPASRAECSEAGMLGLLAKPLVDDDLKRLMAALHLLRPRSAAG